MRVLNYGKEYWYSQKYIKKYRNIIIPESEHNIEYKKLFAYWIPESIKINNGIF